MKKPNKKKLLFFGIGAILLFSAFRRKNSNMSEVDKIKKLALLYEGIEEVGNNQGFNNAVFEDMMKTVGWKDSAQWCAYFTKAIYNYALPDLADDFSKSLSGSSQRSFTNVQAGKSKSLKAITTGKALPGDIVIWQNKNDASTGHAGIILETGPGNKFKSIEGNANYRPDYSGQNELVDIVPHDTAIGNTDNIYSSKKLRGFIRLV
jgi:hypothetical protein